MTKRHTYYQFLKAGLNFTSSKGTLIITFLFFGVWQGLLAQEKAMQKKLIGTQKDSLLKQKTLNNSVFFATSEIYVGKDAVLSIQTSQIVLLNKVEGEGTLHIANAKNINVLSKSAITIEKVQIENTILSLENDLFITNALELKNATILLNNSNLFTNKQILFGVNSKLVYKGSGVWIQKDSKNFQPLTSKQNLTKKNQVDSFFLKNNLDFVLKNKALIARYKELNKESLSIEILDPPPEFVV